MSIIKSEYIRRKLSYIKSMVEDDTKQKLYDINTTSEYIFMQILNDVYGLSLLNANDEKPNFPAIDLIDTVNEIVFQVTSETSTKKVREDTIEKFRELVKHDEYKKYAHYKIKMFYIKNKPNFSDKTLEELESKGVPKAHLLGIEDINREVSINVDKGNKVFETLCKLLDDKNCDSNNISEFDRNLYNEFLSDLPSSGAIGFIHELDFHYVFRLVNIEELFAFSKKWNSAEYEFVDQELEGKRICFYNKLEMFLSELQNVSEGIDTKGTQSIIPREHRGGTKPLYLLEQVKHINNLRTEVFEQHQEFIRLGKELIYR